MSAVGEFSNPRRYRMTVDVARAKSGVAAIRIEDTRPQGEVTFHRAVGFPVGAEVVQEPGRDGAVVCLYAPGFVSRG